MKTGLSALVVGASVLLAAIPVHAQSEDPVGNVENGKKVWRTGSINCKNCHGVPITLPPGTEHLTHQDGEGGYGPDLAGGRGLSFAQFRRAVRQPWGIMPAFTERQMSDQTLADLYAYMKTLPPVKEPSLPRYPIAPEGSPPRQITFTAMPCVMCHRPEMRDRRADLGAKAAAVNYEYFKKVVYEHTSLFPDGNMGNFNPARIPEPILRELWLFTVEDLGFRPLVNATLELDKGPAEDAGTTYIVNVHNQGVPAKGGLAAEGVTVTLVLPEGAELLNASGKGYQGVRRDEKLKASVAVWTAPVLGPAQKLRYSVTLAGPPITDPKSFAGSNVHWEKPDPRANVPNIILKDARIPDKGDAEPIAFRRPVPVD